MHNFEELYALLKQHVMRIGSGTFVHTAYFLFVVSLCFGSGNAFPIVAAPSIGNSKLSGGFKGLFKWI